MKGIVRPGDLGFPPSDSDPAYGPLARDAILVRFRGEELLVCSLGHLRAMKRAADREQDLVDLRALGQ
jgi:hypothetical protein